MKHSLAVGKALEIKILIMFNPAFANSAHMDKIRRGVLLYNGQRNTGKKKYNLNKSYFAGISLHNFRERGLHPFNRCLPK